jgi:capsular polysaccharide biosynthesis protein
MAGGPSRRQITMDRPGWVEGSGRKLLAALWGGWPVVAVAVLLLAGGAYLYAKRLPPVYKASGRIFLDIDTLGQPGQDTERLVSTQAELAASTPVLTGINKRLGVSTEVVEGRLTVTPAPGGNYFTITGTGASSSAAVKLVTAGEQSYQEVVNGQQQKNRQQALDDLVEARINLEREYEQARSQAAAAPGDARLRARVDILQQQLRTLRTRQSDALSASQGRSVVQLAEAPHPPTAPTAPKPLLMGMVAGLLGAIIGIAFVWWRSEWFAVVNQPAIAADELGVALLGRLRPKRWRHADTSDAARADPDLAQLAVAIELAGRHQLGHNLSVLGLTYSDPPASASTATLGLASALASFGRQVLLADGMQHQPLISTLTTQGLLAPDPQDPPAPQALLKFGTEPALLVLSLGLDGRPGQVATAHSALDDARRAGKLVVLLTSPPNTPQAALLITACEALVLVARPRTRLATLRTTKARLDDLDRPILGLIFEKSNPFRSRFRRHRRPQADYQAPKVGPTPSQAKQQALNLPPQHPGPGIVSPAMNADGGTNGGRSRTWAPDLGAGPVEQDPKGIVGATPRGWRKYTEPRFEFSIAVPLEWKQVGSREGVIVFYDPQSDTLVSMEGADSRERSSEHPLWDYNEHQYQEYKRIKLESTVFKGIPALDWDFAHSEDGTRLRVNDLRFFIGDFVYRMSFQSPEAVWSELRSTLFGIRDSFSVGIAKPAASSGAQDDPSQ